MSDSEDEKQARMRGYLPILGDAFKNSPRALRPSASGKIPDSGVSLYQNSMFKDEGDVLGGGGGMAPGQPYQMSNPSPRPNTAQKLGAQSSLAARRQQRMQANVYERNDNMLPKTPGTPAGGAQPWEEHDEAPPSPSPEICGIGSGGGARASVNVSNQAGQVYGLSSSYDPNEEFSKKAPANRRTQQSNLQPQSSLGREPMAQNRELYPPSAPIPPKELDLSDLRRFLKEPGPMDGPIMCYIVRDAATGKFNMFLEEGKKFLLAARKRKKQTTSNYLISLDYEDLGRDSEQFFGKLRGNFVGTDFTIFDDGEKVGAPRKNAPGGDVKGERKELGCITYQYNVLGTRGPRKMTACIPALDSSGRSLYRPRGESDTIVDRLKGDKGLDELVVMYNKPPRWNEELNAYCLNFQGRVTEASVKNFQLVADNDHNHVILQFGKISKNVFTMDYQWPINALQAFAICLSSFDNKLACE